jgi:hypothetical protein
MTSRGGPEFSSQVLEFLAVIRAKERLGAFAILDEGDRERLESLLRRYHDGGITGALEREARTFLVSYREMDKHAGVLDRAERDWLGEILDDPRGRGTAAGRDNPPGRDTPLGRPLRRLRWIVVMIAFLAAAGAATGSYVTSHQSGPPPPVVAQRQAVRNVPPESTDLQNLRQDYGPWRQLAPSGQRPATGIPALLLLEDGGYFASERWTVEPGASGWQQDIGGNVASASVTGDHADIRDADGNSYVVGINQPFIIAGNPGTVLLIDPAGTVRSMPLAQATAVRHLLGK